jgi:mannan endo-1,4-beta-mannosidase
MLSKYHASTFFVTGTGDQFLMYNIGQNINTYGEVTWFKGQLDQAISVINELQIPIVFRLLHEMNGSWFWWGNQAAGGSSSYKKMYQLAVDYIKARTNYALFAWSPNYPFNSGVYPGTNYYPGNQYVDVVGLDMYDINTNSGQPFSTMVNELTALSDFAWNNNKVPVFAEVGNRVNGPNDYPYWWYNLEDYIQGGARSYKVAWMLTWVNQGWDGPA